MQVRHSLFGNCARIQSTYAVNRQAVGYQWDLGLTNVAGASRAVRENLALDEYSFLGQKLWAEDLLE